MALQSSGQITLNDVNVELGNTGTDAITMGSAAVRDLFGVASGEITMADGYGKSSVYIVDYSLNLTNSGSACLSRTPSSGGNRKTWTFSLWLKRASTGNQHLLSSNGSSESTYLDFRFTGGDGLSIGHWNGGGLETNTSYTSTSTWYHIVLALDTTQSTSTDRAKVYVNGSRVTNLSTGSGAFNHNGSYGVNNTSQHNIGVSPSANRYLNGYLADVNFVDGTALTPSSFGETRDGSWEPIKYTGSYGTNGYFLDFVDSGNLGDDESGNGNDWNENSITSSDQSGSSPTD